jgi:Carboxylesterase family
MTYYVSQKRTNIIFGGFKNLATAAQNVNTMAVLCRRYLLACLGLFSQAIMESGSENNLWSLNYPSQKPENYVYQLANKTGCMRPTDDEMIACLKTLPAIVIKRNQDFECTVRI